MSRILIIGVGGQDGRLLYERLSGEGRAVLGIARASVRSTEPGAFAPVDITDASQVRDLVSRWQPDQVFYLAAYHHSAQDRIAEDDLALYDRSHAVHVRGLLHFLTAIRDTAPACRLLYAASSLVFGEAAGAAQTEQTPLNPRCIYGITKTAGVHCCRLFREKHGVHASVGFLYNHESRYRQEKFVSQKIIRAALGITRGGTEKLILGALAARIDWGYAPDYVDAMLRVLALPAGDEFVIATGEAHSVQEFAELAFAHLGLDWRPHVAEDATLIQQRRSTFIGDAAKLRAATGWRPTVTFPQMIARLLDERRPEKA